MIHAFPIRLPRYAFSPREVARAGDIWRAFQEAAVEGSTRQGWSPQRYRESGVGWIVRSMVAVHHRETVFGEDVTARTWVSTFRRGMISHREVRLDGPQGPIAEATQEWVHMREGRPARAKPDLLADFTPEEHGTSVRLPEFESVDGPVSTFTFDAWHTWMDPIGHANHPLYVDWCDEALARQLAGQGTDPQRVVPIAEQVKWKVGVVAPAAVTVETTQVGTTSAGHAVFDHRILTGDQVAATARLVRALGHGP